MGQNEMFVARGRYIRAAPSRPKVPATSEDLIHATRPILDARNRKYKKQASSGAGRKDLIGRGTRVRTRGT